MLDIELRRKIDALWDKFWSGGLANPLTAIDQINYLIFLNRLEAADNLEARRAKASGRSHSSVFESGEHGAQCRWSYFKHLPAEQMHIHLATVVFPWLKQLAPETHAFTAFMRDAAFLIPKPSLLVEAVGVLDDLRVGDRNLDTLGDIYEYMLSKLNVAGQIGQFRTPRHIIRLLVELVEPRLGQVVMDPACGTGGFLIAAHQFIAAKYTSDEFLTRDETGALHGALGDKLSPKQRKTLQAALHGSDFDPTMVRIAAMNMVLHGIDAPNVGYADALGRSFDHSPRAHVVLANPPFSGSVEQGDISDDFRIKTGKTEILFLELIEQVLLPGGRAGVVVPDGVLFTGKKAQRSIRQRLVDHNRLEAVVSLPTGAFKPYAGVKTSVVVFTKGGTTGDVWYFDLRADGYSLDDRRVPVEENDIPDLLAAWPERKETDKSFLVSAEDIRSVGYDLAINAHRPGTASAWEHADPVALLGQAEHALAEVTECLAELRKVLD